MPVSWDEAISEITGRWKEILSRDGGDAILPFYYSGVMSVIQRKCGDAFFNRLGARPLILRLCANAKGMGYASVMGQTPCLEPEELKSSDLILVWSSNVKATRLHVMPILKEARAAGKKVLLIEACAREMDAYCDETTGQSSGDSFGKRLFQIWKRRNDLPPDHGFICIYRRLGKAGRRYLRSGA